MSKELFSMFRSTKYLKRIANYAIKSANIKPGEEVLVLADTFSSRRFLDTFMSIIHGSDVPAQLIITPRDPSNRDIYDYYSYTPPKSVLNAMMGADVIFGLTTSTLINWYSYHIRSKILATSRILWIHAIEDFLFRTAGPNIDLENVAKKGKILSDRFKKINNIKVTSPLGTNVTINGIRNSAVYLYSGKVYKKGDESAIPGGLVYVALERESVNGTIVLDGAMKMLGVLKEPIKLTIKKDKITKVEGGKQAKQLAKYIKKLNDPNFPYIVHIGLGTNPGAKSTSTGYDLESVNGAIIWAIGRQQYFFETKEHLYPVAKGMTAKNHFNPTTLNGTLWFDDELILRDGKYIPSELQ